MAVGKPLFGSQAKTFWNETDAVLTHPAPTKLVLKSLLIKGTPKTPVAFKSEEPPTHIVLGVAVIPTVQPAVACLYVITWPIHPA